MAATRTSSSGSSGSLNAMSVYWIVAIGPLQGGAPRLSSAYDGKMYFRVQEAFLAAQLARAKDGQNWEVWPCTGWVEPRQEEDPTAVGVQGKRWP